MPPSPCCSALLPGPRLPADMGIQAPTEPDVAPMHRQCDVLLGPLQHLAILSMGACHLQAFPGELTARESLRALYLGACLVGCGCGCGCKQAPRCRFLAAVQCRHSRLSVLWTTQA